MTIKSKIVGKAIVITLDRPNKLNATNIHTIDALHTLLDSYSENSKVERILITSDHPKAFCAGGDVRAVYDAINSNKLDEAKNFFTLEYSLIAKMATYKKPIISIVNGMCFGGGMGLSMHNRYRIVSENAVLAMPETIIGFFPDVGSSFRFSNFSKGWRNFYALMGYHIPIALALKNDLADFFVTSNNLNELQQALCECESESEQKIIEKFTEELPKNYETDEIWIEELFEQSLDNIFLSLKENTNQKAELILQDLKNRSPFSLQLTYKLMEIDTKLSLEKSLKLDQIIAEKLLNFHDFTEGVRAQVIDKDKKPKWKHQSITDVSSELINEIFS